MTRSCSFVALLLSVIFVGTFADNYTPFVCNANQCNTYNANLAFKEAKPSDFIGYADVRTEINDLLLRPIKSPQDYAGRLLGSGRGILIYGPPGTGKTFMLSTFSAELKALGWKAWLVRPSDVLTTAWNGEAVQRFNCIFECARSTKNVLLVFDEGEMLLGDRGLSSTDAQLVNVGLNQMNNIENFRVVLLTNYAESIDSAIRRRVGNIYCMRLPSAVERSQIFRYLLSSDQVNGVAWKVVVIAIV